MMSSPKRETKVSAGKAESVARSLMKRLRRSPDLAAQMGSDFNDQYSASPRKAILEKMREQPSPFRPEDPFPAQALFDFLTTQLEGVKDQQFDAHFREIVQVALKLSREDGLRIAAELTTAVLKTNQHAPRMRRVPRAASILTKAFDFLCKVEKPDRELLVAWTEAAQTQLSLAQSREISFSPDEASQLLETLSLLDRRVIPDSLLACVPSLIVLARVDGAAIFLTTKVGEPFSKALAGLTTAQGEDASSNSPCEPQGESLPPREQLNRSFNQIVSVFDTLNSENDNLRQRLSDQEEKVARQAELAKFKAEEHDRQLRITKAEHREEVERSNQRISELEYAETELKESVERLRADLQLTDHNARRGVEEQENESRRRLAEVLNSAIGSLRRDLERALRNSPDDEVIRNVGISFDSLQRRLLRETDHLDDTRLPKELLDPDT